MKILLTGSLGYLGPVVIRTLKQDFPTAHLSGLDMGYFADQHDGRLPTADIMLDQQIYGDVRNVTESDLTGYTHIIHLAAISNDPMGDRFAAITRDINETQSVRIASLAKAAGVQGFVFASSASVYGTGSDAPRAEDSEVAPLTAYAKSKIGAELGLEALSSESFQVSCLRFSTACGWSDRIRLDLVLNDFVAAASTSGRIEVLSDGSPWRPLIHVRDMARALSWAVSEERLTQGSFVLANVGSAEWNFQIGQLAQTVAKRMGGIDVSINAAAPADKRSYRVAFDHWKSIAPSAQPQEDFGQVIDELASQFSLMRDLNSSFRSSRRVRLARLNELMQMGLLSDELRWVSPLRGTE